MVRYRLPRFKYTFLCANTAEARSTFADMAEGDYPYDTWFFGLVKLWRKGLHFRSAGERYEGFYVPEHETGNTRGAPIRVSFSGRFVEEGEKSFFEVSIFPRLGEVLFILALLASVIASLEPISTTFAAVFFIVFAYCYCQNITEAAEEFERIFKQFQN